MNDAISVISLSTGLIALAYLLVRFSGTRSYREIGLFFLIATAWTLEYLSWARRGPVPVSIGPGFGRIAALAAACLLPVSVSCCFGAIRPGRSATAATISSASAAALLLGAGVFLSLRGEGSRAAAVEAFSVALAGLEAAAMAGCLFSGRARAAMARSDRGLAIAFGTLGASVLVAGILSSAMPSAMAARGGVFSLIFALASLAAIGSSLPQAKADESKGSETGDGAAAKSNEDAKAENFSLLSNRELEIAKLLVTGKSYREIGERLFIAPSTVKTHVLRIYEKAAVKNKVELANKLSGSASAALSKESAANPPSGG